MESSTAGAQPSRLSASRPGSARVARRLEVVAGPDAGKKIELAQSSIMIGRTGADLTINDPKVSGLHCELRLQSDGYRVRDLGSTNGTHVKGVRVVDGFIPPGATIQIGKSAIVFDPLDDSVTVPLWHEARLHSLIGGSAAMRQLFDMINRFAQSDATVLIQGETGAGKEGVADAIHQCSPRRDGPFVVRAPCVRRDAIPADGEGIRHAWIGLGERVGFIDLETACAGRDGRRQSRDQPRMGLRVAAEEAQHVAWLDGVRRSDGCTRRSEHRQRTQEGEESAAGNGHAQ